jgi:hypothetical protein
MFTIKQLGSAVNSLEVQKQAHRESCKNLGAKSECPWLVLRRATVAYAVVESPNFSGLLSANLPAYHHAFCSKGA